MSRHTRNIPLLLALAGVCFLSWQAARPVFVTHHPPGEDPDVATYTSTWISGGVTKSVKTTRFDGETPGEHAARHQADVDALQAIYPPDEE